MDLKALNKTVRDILIEKVGSHVSNRIYPIQELNTIPRHLPILVFELGNPANLYLNVWVEYNLVFHLIDKPEKEPDLVEIANILTDLGNTRSENNLFYISFGSSNPIESATFEHRGRILSEVVTSLTMKVGEK